MTGIRNGYFGVCQLVRTLRLEGQRDRKSIARRNKLVTEIFLVVDHTQRILVLIFLYWSGAGCRSIAADRRGLQPVCDCLSRSVLHRKSKVKRHVCVLIFQNEVDGQARSIFRYARRCERDRIAAILIFCSRSRRYFLVLVVGICNRYFGVCQLVRTLRLEGQRDRKIIACRNKRFTKELFIVDSMQCIHIFMFLYWSGAVCRSIAADRRGLQPVCDRRSRSVLHRKSKVKRHVRVATLLYGVDMRGEAWEKPQRQHEAQQERYDPFSFHFSQSFLPGRSAPGFRFFFDYGITRF